MEPYKKSNLSLQNHFARQSNQEPWKKNWKPLNQYVGILEVRWNHLVQVKQKVRFLGKDCI